jgi:predicted O-methyltransferase YrrM
MGAAMIFRFNTVAGTAQLAAVIAGWVLISVALRRRRASLSAFAVALRIVLGGLLGAAIVERYFSAECSDWYGGLLLAVLALLVLAAQRRVSALVLLDVSAPAASLAYAVYRGIEAGVFAAVGPHNFLGTAAVECVAFAAIGWWLWQEERRASQLQRPSGVVFGQYLVLTGAAHLAGALLESQRAGAFANVVGSIVAIAAGGAFIGVVVPRFLRGREEHRILDHVASHGDALQPEYTPPTPECPHPERWKMLDTMTAEDEVLVFLRTLITTVKPNLVLETGTFRGISTLAIAEGLKQNGFGRIITVEYDSKVFAAARERIEKSGLGQWVEYRNESSLDMQIKGAIDLLFCDSEQSIREQEVRRFLPQVNPNGLILVHDASSHYKLVREAVLRLEAEGLISVVLLPTPRGLAVAQKRAGRK